MIPVRPGVGTDMQRSLLRTMSKTRASGYRLRLSDAVSFANVPGGVDIRRAVRFTKRNASTLGPMALTLREVITL